MIVGVNVTGRHSTGPFLARRIEGTEVLLSLTVPAPQTGSPVLRFSAQGGAAGGRRTPWRVL